MKAIEGALAPAARSKAAASNKDVSKNYIDPNEISDWLLERLKTLAYSLAEQQFREVSPCVSGPKVHRKLIGARC
jgi:hypothetical protein